ncbi:GGDEF domain-containing protein [Herbaspirillum autotrophicum]|uniref:GGDEF domain-containing protein n=1 Tax=Herbaspirillum autotrophicum TaxID=180195 RepID=UPI00067C8573|nr:GGDEF domain-containing protein [Herbaspirillum autotrophicum]
MSREFDSAFSSFEHASFLDMKPLTIAVQTAACFCCAVAVYLVHARYSYDLRGLSIGALGAAVSLCCAIWSRTFTQLWLSGLAMIISQSYLLRILIDATPNPAFFIMPVALTVTLSIAGIFSKTWHFLIATALTWLILGRGNFAWSGIEEENVLVVLTTLSGILFGWIISVMLCALRRKNFLVKKELFNLANRDYLTGIDNRRRFMSRMDQIVKGLSMREAFFLMIDIDNFKRINDTAGHDVGDKVIVEVAATIAELTREHYCGRLGGEEFGVLLLDVSQESVPLMLTGMLGAVRAHSIPGSPISISIGGTVMRSGESVSAITQRADQALYQAKRAGKDCFFLD